MRMELKTQRFLSRRKIKDRPSPYPLPVPCSEGPLGKRVPTGGAGGHFIYLFALSVRLYISERMRRERQRRGRENSSVPLHSFSRVPNLSDKDCILVLLMVIHNDNLGCFSSYTSDTYFRKKNIRAKLNGLKRAIQA